MAAPTSLDSAVAWSASLLYKKNPRKGYVQYWGVLRRKSASNPHCIELYEKSEPQFVIDLESVLCIKPLEGKGKEKSRKYEFQIITVSNKHQFATKEAEGCRAWVKKLNRQLFGPPEAGVLYEYRMQILPTTHSQNLGLYGSYIMRVSDSHMTLFSANGTLPTQFNCHLSNVVQANNVKDGMLVIKTDSNSDIGEGGFAFHADDAAEIVSIIEHRRKSQGQRRASKSVSSCPPTSHKPPPLPPSRARTLQSTPSLEPFLVTGVRRVSLETNTTPGTETLPQPLMSNSFTTRPGTGFFSSNKDIPMQLTSMAPGTGELVSDPDKDRYVSCFPEPVYQTLSDPKASETNTDYLKILPPGPSRQLDSRHTAEEKTFRSPLIQPAVSSRNRKLRKQSAVCENDHINPSPYEIPSTRDIKTHSTTSPECNGKVKPYSVVDIPSQPDLKIKPYSVFDILPADLRECEIDSRPPAVVPTPRPRTMPRNTTPAKMFQPTRPQRPPVSVRAGSMHS